MIEFESERILEENFGKVDEGILYQDEEIKSLLAYYSEFIKSVKLNMSDLDTIAMEYPSRKARFALALENQRAKVSELKMELKLLYYQLYKFYRNDAIDKAYKVTEEGLKALIISDERYVEKMKALVQEEHKLGILSACKEALDDIGRMIYVLKGNGTGYLS